jgi:acyl carrier protein
MMLFDQVRNILRDALGLGTRADRLSPASRLLGVLPEFDSMAVVSVLAAIEEKFGFVIHDDEVSADVFETVGTLTEFVERKLNQ